MCKILPHFVPQDDNYLADMYQQRIKKIQNILKEKNANNIFVTNAKNIYYCTGFIGISPQERESSLLITQENAYLFIPAMYEEKSKKLETGNWKLIVDQERHGLLPLFTKYIQPNDITLVEAENLTLTEFERIKNKTTSILQPETNTIEQLRIIKDQTEIEFLQRTCSITDGVFTAIVNLLKKIDYTELHEQDIIDFMRTTGREVGADGFGFDPIVAFGAGAAEPHYISTNKKLEHNNCLLLDFGFAYKGYTADLSRTIFLGKSSEKFREMYTHVLENNKKCIQAIKPGVSTKFLYELSYNYFKEKNLEKYYLHSLGHGVGLDVHEAPSVGSAKETILEPGMTITIEPGLYFANEFGVRTEDVVLVTETGHMVLSGKSEKELIEIGN